MNDEAFFDTELEAPDLFLEEEEFGQEAEFEAGFESEGTGVASHPRFGWVSPVAAELDELETGQAAGLVEHPRFGSVQPVPSGGEFEAGEAAGLEPEIIPPADTRQPIANTLAAPWRWICYLHLRFPRFIAAGSGTLISPRHVLTCGHNLFGRSDGEVRAVTVHPGRNGRNSPFGAVAAVRWNVHPRWRASEDNQFDFALLTLREPIGAKPFRTLGGRPLGYWGSQAHGQGTALTPVNPAQLRGRQARISGYPGDKCGTQPSTGSASRAALQACPPAARGTVQWRADGRITDGAPTRAPRLVLYDMDTMPGHSGSPVWLASKVLLAIHTGPGRVVPGEPPRRSNRGVRITREVLAQVQAWMRS